MFVDRITNGRSETVLYRGVTHPRGVGDALQQAAVKRAHPGNVGVLRKRINLRGQHACRLKAHVYVLKSHEAPGHHACAHEQNGCEGDLYDDQRRAETVSETDCASAFSECPVKIYSSKLKGGYEPEENAGQQRNYQRESERHAI